VADNGKDDNIIYDYTNGVSASGSATPNAPPRHGDRKRLPHDAPDRH